MQLPEILERLKARFPDGGVESVAPEKGDPWLAVPPPLLVEHCRFLRDDPDLAFDVLRCLSGVDLGDRMCVVLHLVSLRRKHTVVLKVSLDRASPEVDSVQALWPAANWFEREAWDLLGIRFKGHPGLERLMLPKDWVGHPLRKDYKEGADYHGIATTRPDLLGGKDA
jgi:NADH-quinone oxidoreductase subunit C